MAFIKPMLASPYPLIDPDWSELGGWWAETKFDGIRLIVEVDRNRPADLLSDYSIAAWSRAGNPHLIPGVLREAIGKLPTGTYDGELFSPINHTSFGATTKANFGHLQFKVFDTLAMYDGREMIDLTDVAYIHRRSLLQEVFNSVGNGIVSLAEAIKIESLEQLVVVRDDIWKNGGEGLVLKQGLGEYKPGKRVKWWVKVKRQQSAVLRVIGFGPSKGEVFDRGPYARVFLEDDNGVRTAVKTRNDYELARFERRAAEVLTGQTHPDIGRQLRIEFHKWTPDGNYQEPRWDRWEDE
jgi:ATP-dependent DNA ligase